MSGRLVTPCSECGVLLRLSAMRFFTAVGALGLLEGTPGLGQFVLHLAHAFLDSRLVGRGLQARRD